MEKARADWRVAPTGEAEAAAILALNNGALPHVNELDAAALMALLERAEAAFTAWRDETVAGFLVAFGPGAAYDSPNYRWFDARYDDFLYVDRIVVAEAGRGLGIGRGLYRAAFERADRRPLCCEVNLRPPNAASLRFHQGLGFREVGRQQTDGGAKEVTLLVAGG